MRELRALLAAPVNTSTLSRLLRGQLPDTDALATEVDRLLEQARVDAQNSGRPLEEVLRGYGFDLDEGPPTGAPPPVRPPARRPAPVHRPAVEPAKPTQDPLQEHPESPLLWDLLAPARPEDLRPLLVGEGLERLVARAGFLALLDGDGSKRALASGQWQELLHLGLGSEALATVLRCDLWFPHTQGERDLHDLVLARGLVRWRELGEVREAAREAEQPFWQVALREGLLLDGDYLAALAELHDLPVHSSPIRFAKTVLEALRPGWVRHFPLVPLRRTRAGSVLAVGRPLPAALLERITSELEHPVTQELCAPALLDAWREAWLERWLDLHPDAPEARDAGARLEADGASTWAFSEPMDRLSAPELVERVVMRALEARATDIHAEPGPRGGRVRLRVDGICQAVLDLSRRRYEELVARVKVLAEMDVTERRRPQDGNLVLEQGDERHNMRIATVPTVHGEKLAVRLANTQRVQARLEELGLSPRHLELLRELSARPFGMLLATGPVGSGKTTTLYSCLHELDREHFNVMSIEDPVEIRLEGVSQLEVAYGLGFDFSAGLRALLRQDPDAILVGEIRDRETAQIAVRAGMTGLRVYSTMHTNESTGAVTALRNFELSAHLIASSLQGVIAQRLLRRLCPACRRAQRPSREELAALGIERPPRGFEAWRAVGCDACQGTGYAGRVGVFEIFPVTSAARELILGDAGERRIRDHAREQGLITLQQDGLAKVAQGLTTLFEYRRVLNF